MDIEHRGLSQAFMQDLLPGGVSEISGGVSKISGCQIFLSHYTCIYIIYIRLCHAHACFIFNSICHFSYVLINSELIGLKSILEEAIFATGKPQFCLKWCFFPKRRLFSEKTSFHYIQW